MYYTRVEPLSLNFRVLTVKLVSVRKFRNFTVIGVLILRSINGKLPSFFLTLKKSQSHDYCPMRQKQTMTSPSYDNDIMHQRTSGPMDAHLRCISGPTDVNISNSELSYSFSFFKQRCTDRGRHGHKKWSRGGFAGNCIFMSQ